MKHPYNEKISTVHLGQYTRETANEIAGELERADIVWWYKEPGYVSQVWEFGVRLFVDKTRLAEAKEIAERIVKERNPQRSRTPFQPGSIQSSSRSAEGWDTISQDRGSMEKLLSFLQQLRAHSLNYDLRVSRPEAILVMVYVPGHRFEVEFFVDGHVEVEQFTSPGDIFGDEALADVLAYGEPPT